MSWFMPLKEVVVAGFECGAIEDDFGLCMFNHIYVFKYSSIHT